MIVMPKSDKAGPDAKKSPLTAGPGATLPTEISAIAELRRLGTGAQQPAAEDLTLLGAVSVMNRILNYTPHRELTYMPDGGEPIVLPQQGNVRLVEEYQPTDALPNGLPLTWLRYGKPAGLPEPRNGLVYVVSQLVVNACPDRDDLVFPAGLVRNDAGDIVGFRFLARNAPAGN